MAKPKLRVEFYKERRKKLEQNPPVECPFCTFSDSYSLMDWFSSKAVWRCGECKKQFRYEPLIIDED